MLHTNTSVLFKYGVWLYGFEIEWRRNTEAVKFNTDIEF